MKVTLIGHTFPVVEGCEANDVVFTALSQCYNEHYNPETASVSKEKKNYIIKHVLNSGHESVAEHISMTFLVEDVSRVLTHQLVRHRIASYSQRSARYTKINPDNDWYHIPDHLNKEQRDVYVDIMKKEAEAYQKLLELGTRREDARYIVGDCQYTNIVVTMNLRSLKHFFGERLCVRAQDEIRELAKEMAKICKEKFPDIFIGCNFAESKCVQNGGCIEHNTCGRMPRLERCNEER